MGNDARRGDVRGAVIRLSAIQFQEPDSASVVLLLTSARSEDDNTALIPSQRYYIYELVRAENRWTVLRAQRAIARIFLPPPRIY